ncbi:SHOCT domain-containing protein [Paenibacillus sp. p3-SID867]|uniref:SHOCT domain-containing protein n=1 Tax=Paenibacillus sp. p3-SID867 TaxID=2916363 RepID=UPI0021A2A5A0|nr:SHOCT domain-containing protein [Paenibacillus sp. p3-SID867]MCT1403060.1 SHOCT domain-containing protein [Paenibacillus sp. p3-SID867]
MMINMNNSFMMMCMLLMFLGVLILIVAVGVSVYWVVASLTRKNRTKNYPIMILAERYAKGEITEEEFKQRKTIIEE